MGLKHSHTSANRAIAYKAIVTNTNVTFLVSEVSCTDSVGITKGLLCAVKSQCAQNSFVLFICFGR